MLESNGGGILEAFESLLSNIFIPALKKQTNWGCLSDSHGIAIREEFLSKLTHFVSVLNNARASLADLVNLSPCEGVDISTINGPAQIIAAANNSEVLEAAEQCAIKWCKEIEQILTESEQMRKEADDIGPRAELDHWKKRMAKFDSLSDCIKSPQRRTVIAIIIAAKSRVLKVIMIVHKLLLSIELIYRHGNSWTLVSLIVLMKLRTT